MGVPSAVRGGEAGREVRDGELSGHEELLGDRDRIWHGELTVGAAGAEYEGGARG